MVDLIIHKIPRRCGMAGLYTILAILGLTFFISKVRYNVILSSLIMGISRIASSTFFRYDQILHLRCWRACKPKCLLLRFSRLHRALFRFSAFWDSCLGLWLSISRKEYQWILSF